MVLRKATSEVIRHQGRCKVPSANSCAIDLLVILNTTGEIHCCNAGYYLWKNTAPVSARFQLLQKCWTKRPAISTWRHIPRDGGWGQPAAQGGQEDAAEGGVHTGTSHSCHRRCPARAPQRSQRQLMLALPPAKSSWKIFQRFRLRLLARNLSLALLFPSGLKEKIN